MLAKVFSQNTTFHGIRFLTEDGRHWSERIFWVLCTIASWVGSGALIRIAWYDFQNNAITFVVETSYLEWDTKFPSVGVCEYDNQRRIAEITDSLFGDPHDYNMDEVVKELVYFRGLSYYILQLCGPDVKTPDPNCEKYNFSFYSSLVRSKCNDTFRECKWNHDVFDCCKYFLPIDTELGVCYVVNSIQSRDKRGEKIPMISNKKTGPGNLYLEIIGHTNVYILGDQDVPSLTTLQTNVLQIAPHLHYHRYMAIKEIENDAEVRDVSVSQRNCRYTDENYLDVYDYYSYSACSVQCRKDAQIRLCGCTHHLMPNTPKQYQCNVSGMACLNHHYNELAVLRARWAKRTGLVCDCLPSCTETEMFIIKDDSTGIASEYAIVEFTLERLPSERFKRNVVRGKLDLVVSMGGTTALFLGASLLSFVELMYFFSLRAISNAIIRRKARKRGIDNRMVTVKAQQPLPITHPSSKLVYPTPYQKPVLQPVPQYLQSQNTVFPKLPIQQPPIMQQPLPFRPAPINPFPAKPLQPQAEIRYRRNSELYFPFVN